MRHQGLTTAKGGHVSHGLGGNLAATVTLAARLNHSMQRRPSWVLAYPICAALRRGDAWMAGRRVPVSGCRPMVDDSLSATAGNLVSLGMRRPSLVTRQSRNPWQRRCQPTPDRGRAVHPASIPANSGMQWRLSRADGEVRLDLYAHCQPWHFLASCVERNRIFSRDTYPRGIR